MMTNRRGIVGFSVGLVLSTLLLNILCFYVSAAPISTWSYTATGIVGTLTGSFGWDHAASEDGWQATDTDVGLWLGAGFISGSVSGGAQDGGSFSITGLDVQIHLDPATPGNEFIAMEKSYGSGFWWYGRTIGLGTDELSATMDLTEWIHPFIDVYGSDIGQSGREHRYIFDTITPFTTVPEPTTFLLMGIGLAGIAGAEVRRRRKKKAVDNS